MYEELRLFASSRFQYEYNFRDCSRLGCQLDSPAAATRLTHPRNNSQGGVKGQPALVEGMIGGSSRSLLR